MTPFARDRKIPKPGVVHFGPGAFARAHIATYIDELLAQIDAPWGITGVSLKTSTLRDQLKNQDWAYTVIEAEGSTKKIRKINAFCDILVAQQDPVAVASALDDCKLVTLTITEKGYCHHPASGALDLTHPDIRADLDPTTPPATAMGYITDALARRHKAGRVPFTVLSADNLPENGKLLRGLVLTIAAARDPDLATWIDTHVPFPCSMVDRIVPAMTPQSLAQAQHFIGEKDAAPVLCEPFRQWVIEDHFAPDTRPPLDRVGAQFVQDVAPFEHMKLRMLNGTHSALAYLGYLAGKETISEAIADPTLAKLTQHLWANDIAPTLTPPPGVSLATYADQLFARYTNPAIVHRTQQIAMDGSQKLPQRILETIQDNLARNRTPHGLILTVAAWMIYTSGKDLKGQPVAVKDPMAEALAAHWHGGDVTANYLAMTDVFPEKLAQNTAFRTALETGLIALQTRGVTATIQSLVLNP